MTLLLATFVCAAAAFAPPCVQRRQRHRAAPLLLSMTTSRRNALHLLGGAASLEALAATPAWANTQPMMEGTMAGFDAAAEKRVEYQAKQKAYKKAWRRELSNLEFSTSDEEAKAACIELMKLIRANGNTIPEGIRKMDLDQVYKGVKPRLEKPARMVFADLDKLVLTAVSAKRLSSIDDE